MYNICIIVIIICILLTGIHFYKKKRIDNDLNKQHFSSPLSSPCSSPCSSPHLKSIPYMSQLQKETYNNKKEFNKKYTIEITERIKRNANKGVLNEICTKWKERGNN